MDWFELRLFGNASTSSVAKKEKKYISAMKVQSLNLSGLTFSLTNRHFN